MDIMKLADGICEAALVKDYAVYKKWINEWCNEHFMASKGNKITFLTLKKSLTVEA